MMHILSNCKKNFFKVIFILAFVAETSITQSTASDLITSSELSIIRANDEVLLSELPVVVTSTIINIAAKTSSCGGNVISDGGTLVTSRGVCYSTTPNPTITDSKTTNGIGTGSYNSFLTGLIPNTLYYVRAYSTTIVGTSYGDQKSFATTQGTATVRDIDGNVYPVVTIGSQVWMGENLKVTHYLDGSNIPNVTDDIEWNGLTSGAYCWYNNDPSTYSNPYGGYYNWYAVTNSSEICPSGWHVPTLDEWTEMGSILDFHGSGMKEAGIAHWSNPNDGDNSSGFSAVGGGMLYSPSVETDFGRDAFFWSSSNFINDGVAWEYWLRFGTPRSDFTDWLQGMSAGLSVRCLNDLSLSQMLPSQGGAISGNTTVCQGQNSVSYTVAVIANATSYNWTLPSGATGTSTTNSITVNYGVSAVSENITVKGNNSYGDGAVSTLAITVNLLPAISETITGNTTVCQGQNSVSYTVPVIANATSYIWTLPSGTTGTSTTNSITVNFGIVAASGNITLKGNNSCGDGPASTLAITVLPPSIGGSVAGGTSICNGSISGLLVLTGQTGTIVKWQSSVTPFSSWTDIANTATSYTSEVLAETTQFRAIIQSGSCTPANSGSTTVTVDPPSVGGSVMGGTSTCNGSTSGLLTLSGHTGTVLKWQSSVSPFSVWDDINNQITTYTSGALTETTKFRAVVQSGSCASASSGSTTVTVDPPSVGGNVTGGTTICSGSTSGLLDLSGHSGTVVKWQSTVAPFNSWTDIANTSTTYTSGVLNETTQFRAVVQSGSCSIANSEVVTVNVDPISVGGSVTGGATICFGSTSGLLTLLGHTGNIVKWQNSVSPFSSWTDIANTADTYTSGALTETTQFRAIVQSGSCTSASSGSTTVTVDPPSVGGSVMGGTSTCNGSTSGLLTLSGHTGTVLKWQSSVSPFSVWDDINNQITTYTSGALTETTKFRAVVQSGSCTSASSGSTTVTVNPSSVGGRVTGGTSTCKGSTSGLLSLTAQTGTVVKWQSSVSPFNLWTDIANTATTYTSGTLAETTKFRAVVQSGNCGIVNSAVLEVTVDSPSVGGNVTGGTTICSGSTSGLLSLSGLTGSIVKWQSSVSPFSSWTDIANTADTYTSGALTETTQFRAIIQSGSCASANSGVTTVIVDPLSIGGSVAGGTSICNGSISGLLVLTGQTGTIVKWQSSVTPFSSWTDIANTATSYTSEALAETKQFRAIVQSGSCTSANSGSTTVTVDPPSVGGSVMGGTSTCNGSTSGLLTLSGHTGTVMKWQSSVSPFSSWTNIDNQATTYISEALTETAQFRVIVQSGSCASASSGSTSVTIDPSSVGGNVTGGTTICSGSTSGLLDLTGQTGTIIKWQRSVTPFSSWTDIANTATSYTSGALSETTQFRAIVQSGSCASANSVSTTVSVNPSSVGGRVTGGTSTCNGSTSGLLSLTAQTGTVVKWQSSASPFNLWTDIANTATFYTSGTLAESTQFRAVVQSGNCVIVNSAVLKVTVDSPSVGGNVTGGTTICSGSTSGLLSLSVHTGSIIKWQSSVSPFNFWTDIVNTADTYNSGALTETTQFRAIVQSGSCASANSGSTIVTVDPPSVGGSVTGGTSICKGSTSGLLSITGQTGTIVKWQSSVSPFNLWTDIANTATTYTSGVLAETTQFRAVVQNKSCATAISISSTVTVNPLPVPTITGPVTTCMGGSYTYITEANMTGYTWNISEGGTITAGSATNSITVTWNDAGAQQVNVNYINANGCTAKAASLQNVTVNQLPVPPTIAGLSVVCEDTANVTYTTEAGMTGYTWIVSSSGDITSGATSKEINVTWKMPGAQTVTVNYTNASGCTAKAVTVKNLTVNPLPVPTITGQVNTCMGINYNYTTEAGMSGYTWIVSPGGTITDGSTINNINVTWKTAGVQTISVNYINANGCIATNATEKTVTVNQLPVPTITGISTVCAETTDVKYTTESGMSGYMWTISGGGVILDGVSTNTINVRWITPGIHTVTVNYINVNGCTATTATDKTITVNPCPIPTIKGQASVCIGNSGITYTTEAAMAEYTWVVSAGGTIISGIKTNTITVVWNTIGDQKLSVNYLDAEGCSAINATEQNVTVNPLPVPTISTSDTTWIGSSYIYKTEADMTNYKWIVSSGGIISTGTETNSTTVKWINYGWQTLSINYINENGCKSEDATIMKMKVINPPLSKTEGISPNGDGINDILIFKDLKNYPGSKLIIFTRIGEKIYESDNYLNDWDGKFLNNGSKDKVTVLSGTCYYVLRLGGTNRTIKGFIYVGY